MLAANPVQTTNPRLRLAVATVVGFAVASAFTITTLAGGGGNSNSGPATSAAFQYPQGVAVDRAGVSVLVSDTYDNRVWRVNVSTGVIAVYAGTSAGAYGGDGGSAVLAQLNLPVQLAYAPNSSDAYVCDFSNSVLRRVTSATGVISTFVGSGTAGFTGDGGAATNARMNGPSACVHACRALQRAVLGSGAARSSWRDPCRPSVTVVHPPAHSLACPHARTARSVAFDSTGALLVVESNNHVVRSVLAGIVTTAAGVPGVAGFTGDGGAATSAHLHGPDGIAVDSS